MHFHLEQLIRYKNVKSWYAICKGQDIFKAILVPLNIGESVKYIGQPVSFIWQYFSPVKYFLQNKVNCKQLLFLCIVKLHWQGELWRTKYLLFFYVLDKYLSVLPLILFLPIIIKCVHIHGLMNPSSKKVWFVTILS